jgi:Mg-chelatase subunit ChlD
MARATDKALRALARRLAGRLVLDLARTGRARGRGVGRLDRGPLDAAVGDLDLDASLPELVEARAGGRAADASALVTERWRRPTTAVCLLVDRSGSMSGPRLATAALAAAVCAWRAPSEFAVAAFSDRVVVLKAIDQARRPEEVVVDALTLQGHGTTDVALALRAAWRQLARSRATRRITVLLSDAEVTAGDDPVPAARALDELVVVAPADGPEAAAELARRSGARFTTVASPRDVLRALREVLS